MRHAPNKLFVKNVDVSKGSAVCSIVWTGVVSHNDKSNHNKLATIGVAIEVPS
jgi:hypothetical protein